MAGPAHAADEPVQKALKAIEKHRYEEASRDLRQALPSIPAAKQPSAKLALGMAYLRNAELHRGLHAASVAVNADYLKRLAGDRGAGRSRASDLYLGVVNLENGKADAAAQAFEKFLAGGPVDERSAAVARIGLGTARWTTGDKAKAQEQWDAVKGDAEVMSELAAALSRAGLKDKDPAGLCSEAVNASRKGGKGLPQAVIKNCLGVYVRAGDLERGSDLLEGADLRSPVYRETIGKSKVLSFHDPRLLENLSAFYLQSALAALDTAAADQQIRNIASYYLGEAQLLAGNAEQAAKATTTFLGAAQAPPQYRSRALVRQGAIQYQKGKQADAIGTWNDLARSQQGDPEVLAEVLNTCSRLRIDCPRMAQTAAAAAEGGEGKRFAGVNIGLGRYALMKKDQAKAIAYLEAGRDKSNKNKIEFNDPVMLVDLADAYYRTKKFSEALEIYFEMSKQFPQVRQIQEALQGIYSMEHKSAGDVKIN